MNVENLKESVKFIDNFLNQNNLNRPKIAISLGSGLHQILNKFENLKELSFSQIPYFLPDEKHNGSLYFTEIYNKPICFIFGRLPYFEGYSMDQVVYPIRTLALLGLDQLILTNAAGAINPKFRESDLMIITDHINLMGDNPLRGKFAIELGARFPDLSETYSSRMIDIFEKEALKLSIPIRKGVYVAITGPTFETPAEIRMMRILGGDAVGMTTVPEAIAANHLGVEIFGLSCITNMASGMTNKKISHQEILENMKKTANHLYELLIKTLPNL
jgi:purine-nucleoside phosphorylase